MAKRIFLDTNILLDVLLERGPFCQPAQLVWSLAERKEIKAGISAVSLNNVFFIIKKLASKEKAYFAINTLVEIFKICPVTSQTISKALKLDLPDFEDALQYICALQFRAKTIITRDFSGFKKSKISVMDASQYLTLP